MPTGFEEASVDDTHSTSGDGESMDIENDPRFARGVTFGRKSVFELKTASSNVDRMETYARKIGDLSETLLELHSGLDDERNTRFEHLQGNLKGLEDRITAWQNVGTKKFGSKKQMLLTFQDEFDQEKAKREEYGQTQAVSRAQLKAMVEQAISGEQNALRGSEQKAINLFEQKVCFLRGEMSRSSRQAEDNTANLRRYLEEDVPQLYQDLREETQAREAMEQNMLTGAMEEVRELQRAVAAERRARQDTEEVMLRMMEDAVAKMQQELLAERRERQNVESMLVNLLQDTCHKLKATSKSL
eukprot:TRINITY_DN48484_c0_g1_i1.p1 TRINITY_DN48484_c0_g1~~TRINITY_DN48484_c0_g1_i1.p1  ORF type:complete len:301 (+),score=96.11 TRINITY_DN48484_c0_g1_i1:58-960(+)